MFGTRAFAVSLLIAAAVAPLVGCGSRTQQAAGPAPRSVAVSAAARPMAAGMTMPDGAVMDAPSVAASSADGQAPSAAATMICSAEFRHDLAEALAGTAVPAGTRTFHDSLLSCDYALFGGHLEVSVKDLADPAATDAYFATRRRSLTNAHLLDGLTPGAVGNGGGIVVLRKDNHVLTVDTSAMPTVFGSQRNKRAEFAYEVAAVVLGCWTGN